ncbi:hypothetical protein Q7P36_006003 [Cladosporium allicinum]
MDSTQARRRPGVTRKRSRSVLPRLKTREQNYTRKRRHSSFMTVLFSLLQLLLIVILASLAFLSFATWADETWLPRFCEQSAIEQTSAALSRVTNVDICKTSLAGHAFQTDHPSPTPTNLNAALAIIQQGQAVGGALEDLIDSWHDFFSSDPEVASRIDGSALRDIESDDTRDSHQALHYDILTSNIAHWRFMHSDLRRIVVFAKYEYREVARVIANTVEGARRSGPGRCFFFEHWVYGLPLVGSWSPRAFPATRLLGEFERLNAALLPQLGTLYRARGRERKGADDDVLVADIEQHILDHSHLSVVLDTIREQSAELGTGLLVLLKMIERHRCLGLSQEDGEALAGELAKLQASIDEIESRWGQALEEQKSVENQKSFEKRRSLAKVRPVRA